MLGRPETYIQKIKFDLVFGISLWKFAIAFVLSKVCMSIWELVFAFVYMGIGIYFYTHKKIYLFLRDGDLYPKLLVNKKN